MHKIMQSCLHIKSCKYQLFQHVTAQGEDVHYKCCCDLRQNMQDKKNVHVTYHESVLCNGRFFKWK